MQQALHSCSSPSVRKPLVSSGLAGVFVLLGALPSLAAGDVWVVDDDGGAGVDFTDLQPAIDAAGEGDTILVKAGLYGPFDIDAKSLVIVGERGELAEVATTVQVRNLAANQHVTLQGLGLTGLGFWAVNLVDNEGPVWLERLSSPRGLVFGLSATDSSQVIALDCQFTGESLAHGLVATRSSVFAYDCLFFGSDAGVRLDGSTLYAAGSTFRGYDGEGCSVGHLGALGGDALMMVGASEAYLLDTDLEPGMGAIASPPFACGDGPDGRPVDPPSANVSFLRTVARGLSLDSPSRVGESVDLTVQGPPGEFVLLLYSTEPLALLQIPFESASLTSFPSFRASLGFLPVAGQKTSPRCSGRWEQGSRDRRSTCSPSTSRRASSFSGGRGRRSRSSTRACSVPRGGRRRISISTARMRSQGESAGVSEEGPGGSRSLARRLGERWSHLARCLE